MQAEELKDRRAGGHDSRRGQILVEVVVASLIIVIISLAIAQEISASIQGERRIGDRATAVLLAQEDGEAMRAVALEDWHNISGLATSSANQYHPAVSSGRWVVSSGAENVSLNGITYNRFFYLTDVYRSTSTGNIVSSGGYLDPSTAKVNITVNWTDLSNDAQTFLQELYLSRFLNQSYSQTDWSGGAAGDVVTSVATTTFATSTSVDTTSVTGSIQLQSQ